MRRDAPTGISELGKYFIAAISGVAARCFLWYCMRVAALDVEIYLLELIIPFPL
jgi:hypothetical protein